MSREVTRVHEDSYAIYLLSNLFDFWIPSFENLEGYVTVVKHSFFNGQIFLSTSVKMGVDVNVDFLNDSHQW